MLNEAFFKTLFNRKIYGFIINYDDSKKTVFEIWSKTVNMYLRVAKLDSSAKHVLKKSQRAGALKMVYEPENCNYKQEWRERWRQIEMVKLGHRT